MLAIGQRKQFETPGGALARLLTPTPDAAQCFRSRTMSSTVQRYRIVGVYHSDLANRGPANDESRNASLSMPVDIANGCSRGQDECDFFARVGDESGVSRARSLVATKEMTSLKAILNSGMAALQDSFWNLAEQTHSMDVAAGGTLGRAESLDSERLVRLAVQGQATYAQLSAKLDRAIQAVQFDDMATQLIGCVTERLGRIDCGLDASTTAALPVLPPEPAADRPRIVTFGNDTTAGDIEFLDFGINAPPTPSVVTSWDTINGKNPDS